MKQDSNWIYQIRGLGRILDWLFGCTRNAALVLSATASTDRTLPSDVPTLRMIENGVDLDRFHTSDSAIRSTAAPMKIVFVGRLLPFKGVPMLLRAVP
jgi:glycosyltransferase involved in cell wall biosynthesis